MDYYTGILSLEEQAKEVIKNFSFGYSSREYTAAMNGQVI